MNRRDFLGLTVASTVLFSQNTNLIAKPPQTYRVRKNIATLSSTSPEINSLKRVVEKMRSLPSSNPMSWDAQMRIHKKFCDENVVHGSWFFLPWHRAYLYYFEKICIQILKDYDSPDMNPDEFAIPYWDWSAPTIIPRTFLETDSPLYDSTRNEKFKDNPDYTITDDMLKKNTIDGLRKKKFSLFHGVTAAGYLENIHTIIHTDFIKGNMKNLNTAASDPIFWLHHANVDKIWTKWAREHSGEFSNHPNWARTFKGFYDVDGNHNGSKTIQQLLSTHDLGYHYDYPGDEQYLETKQIELPLFAPINYFVQLEPKGTALLDETFAANVTDVPQKLDESVKNIAKTQYTDNKAKPILQLTVEVGKPQNHDISVMVFMFTNSDFNPDGKLKNPSELSVDSVSYVGSIYFLESSENHNQMMDGMVNMNSKDSRSFLLNATETIWKLANKYKKFIYLSNVKVLIAPILLEGATEGSMDEIELKSFKFEFIK